MTDKYFAAFGKRVISALICLMLLASCCSLPSAAEEDGGDSRSYSVTNVRTGISITGERYCRYEMNGVEYDSRYTGARFNAYAWERMSTADRRSVAVYFADKSERQSVFGNNTSDAMAAFVNEKAGWTGLWAAYEKKVEEKYCGVLQDWFSDENYGTVLAGLTGFPENSDARTVLNRYSEAPEANEFMAKYNAIAETMSLGRRAYANIVNAVLFARKAGTCAISKELISQITSNFLVPAVTVAPSAATTGLWTKVYDLSDALIGISGSVQEKAVGKTVDAGDAASICSAVNRLTEANYELAKAAYLDCAALREQLEHEGIAVMAAIRKREKAAADASKPYQEQLKERRDAARHPSAGVEPDPAYSAPINSRRPTADPMKKSEEELYERQLAEQMAQAQSEWSAIEAEFEAWKEGVLRGISSAAQSAGFVPYDVQKGEERGEGCSTYDIRQGWYHIEHGSIYDTVVGQYYPHRFVLSSAALAVYYSDIQKVSDWYDQEADMLEALAAAVPGLAESELRAWQAICAKARAVEETGVTVKNRRYSLLDMTDTASLYLSYINQMPADRSVCASLRAKREELTEDYEYCRRENLHYREQLTETFAEFKNIVANAELAAVDYFDTLRDCRKLLNETIPQYVRDQKADTLVGTLSGTSNAELKALLGPSNGEAFTARLRAEALKLSDYREQYLAYTNQLAVDCAHMRFCCGEFYAIGHFTVQCDGGTVSGREALEAFGVNSSGFVDYTELDAYKLIYEYYRVDAYRLSPTEQEYAETMKLLIGDLMGQSFYNNFYLQCYEQYCRELPNIRRQLQNGNSSRWNYYYNRLQSLCRQAGGSAYNAGIVNPGLSGERVLSSDVYGSGENSLNYVWEHYRGSGSYIPVRGISKGGGDAGLFGEDDGSVDLSLNEGERVKLSVVFDPLDSSDQGLLWQSLTPELASVDESGTVTALGEGIAVISVCAADAPLEVITDSSGAATAFHPIDGFALTYRIGIVGMRCESFETESGNVYSLCNIGTAEEPRYMRCSAEDGRIRVEIRYRAPADGAVLGLAVYDRNGKMTGLSFARNDADFDGSRELSVVCPASEAPAEAALLLMVEDDGGYLPYLGAVKESLTLP